MTTIITREKRASVALPILFTLTAFTGAALLFIVEPLIAKLLLPEFGGASSVWTTATFFFQVIMLGSYLFIHGTARFGPRKHPFLQLLLVAPALIFLPIALPAADSIAGQEPFTRLLLTLVVAIGLPFAVLATTGPLIQRWYSWAGGPRSQDPYFLYAASNAGSFIGLFAYPFLIEPFFTLEQQQNYWSIAFVGFILLVAACGVVMFRRSQAHRAAVEEAEASVPKLKVPRQLWWIFLAFIPASLQLGVTTYLTTDVASFPLLFIVPLGIYLATMIAAFARKSKEKPKVAIGVAVVASVGGLAVALIPQVPIILAFGTLLFTLGAVSYAAHASLAADRPATKYLTRYFVYISLGGAIGGAFNSLIAPFIFVNPMEFPLVLSLTALLLLPLLATRKRKLLAYLLTVIMLMVTFMQSAPAVNTVASGRTFYGAWTVNTFGDRHNFSHGTTIHGSQLLERPEVPTAYYAAGTPLADIMAIAERERGTHVGLGAGAIAAYGLPGESMHFIEIDPSVIEVAQNIELFSYLTNSEADIKVSEGDGRLVLREEENASQDLIALDAFSSDSIPVHLLTLEAFEEYSSKLTQDGVLAVHISNRVFDLQPVVIEHAKELGYTALIKTSEGLQEDDGAVATWMVLTKDPAKVTAFENEEWSDVTDAPGLSWTDDHSSVLEALAPEALGLDLVEFFTSSR